MFDRLLDWTRQELVADGPSLELHPGVMNGTPVGCICITDRACFAIETRAHPGARGRATLVIECNAFRTARITSPVPS
jgi:hypothetical protein